MMQIPQSPSTSQTQSEELPKTTPLSDNRNKQTRSEDGEFVITPRKKTSGSGRSGNSPRGSFRVGRKECSTSRLAAETSRSVAGRSTIWRFGLVPTYTSLLAFYVARPPKNPAMPDLISKTGFDVQEEHFKVTGEADQKQSSAILVSAFASHSRKEILRKFWRLYAIGLAVSIGGMYGGYCSSATGNIVANPGKSTLGKRGLTSGFIRQFGTVVQSDGSLALDASHVSFWSGFQYVGQVVFQCISPFVADRFGRKAAMFSVLVLMLTVKVLLAARLAS